MNKPSSRSSQRLFQLHDAERLHALQGLPLATFRQRVLGYLIDILLALLIWDPLEYSWRRFLLHQDQITMRWDFHEIGNIAVMLAYFACLNFFGNGRTPGKFLAGTRVKSLHSDRLGLWQSIERALGYGAALLEGGLGFARFFRGKNRMCAQDRLAETIVLDVRVNKSTGDSSSTNPLTSAHVAS